MTANSSGGRRSPSGAKRRAALRDAGRLSARLKADDKILRSGKNLFEWRT